MAKKQSNTPITEVIKNIIDPENTFDDNVKLLVEAFDSGLFGGLTIGELQSHLGDYYAAFVRTIHLR